MKRSHKSTKKANSSNENYRKYFHRYFIKEMKIINKYKTDAQNHHSLGKYKLKTTMTYHILQ
jgi:hypothetical protein